MYNFENNSSFLDGCESEYRIKKEKSQLKSRCNFVGLIILISTFVFLFFTVFVYVLYGVAQSYVTPATFNEASDSLGLNILTGLCNVVAIGICGALFVKHMRSETQYNLPFKKVRLKKLTALCVIGFTVCNLSNYMTSIFMNTAYSFGIDLNIDSFNNDSNSVLEIIVYILSVAVVPAFSEELLFRGAVLGALRKYGDGFAVFISSLFFGIFHGNFVQFPFAFFVGLILSFSVVYTNSMLPAILIHFSNNSFSVVCDVLYTNVERWNLNEKIIDISIYVFVITMAVTSLIALIKLEKNDTAFLKLSQYNGPLERKVINKTILTSPLIIISFLILLGECVLSHINI